MAEGLLLDVVADWFVLYCCVHSKVSHPASTTHRQLDDTALATARAQGQMRLLVGVEDPGDLFADLRQALDAS
ncbi:MAG TPA: PLP-dependent transferase [Pseudonocardiaceae bacterium]|nr:PLP-dependent transferase [Pseudonocardiaceae bacterium]